MTPPDWDEVRARQREMALPPPDVWSAPMVLPPGWAEVARMPDGAKYSHAIADLIAIVTCTREQDQRWWIHLSVSHRTRVPKWRELVEVKEVFLGDREAYQVLPPRERYVNIHPHVLHLFALADPKATALPDFTWGLGSL